VEALTTGIDAGVRRANMVAGLLSSYIGLEPRAAALEIKPGSPRARRADETVRLLPAT
jgi:hypothetical protein